MKRTIKVALTLKDLLVTNEVFGLLITIVMVIMASAGF
jgi:flagellin-like protein